MRIHLLILDEPTSALDPEGRAEVMDIISNLGAAGSTIILCTHILADVERIANKIGILKDGIMAVEGHISDVKKNFSQECMLCVRLRNYNSNTVETLRALDLVKYSEVYDPAGVMLYAKDGVTEKELYNQVINALTINDILPEAIEFKRLSLEQIYLGINSGTYMPVIPALPTTGGFLPDQVNEEVSL
jgi:ABC-2 type transport system ATP-binding protein